MFIELMEPEIVDLYVTKDRVKIRLREKSAPGRIWLNLTYKNVDEAKKAIEGVLKEIEKGPRSYPVEALPV